MESKDFTFKWIGAGTWILKIENLTIACDPCLSEKNSIFDFRFFKAKRLEAPEFQPSDFEAIDIWLITHQHEDHLDKEGADVVKSPAEVVTHENAVKKLSHVKGNNLHILNWDEKISFDIKEFKIEITAVPAIHGSNFITAYLAGGVNGYKIKLKKGDYLTNIYVTGDTILHSKVISALQNYQPDLLIANIGAAKMRSFGGPFTLTWEQLETLTQLLKPRITLPVHFHTFSHYEESPHIHLKRKRSSFLVPDLGNNIAIKI